MSFQNPLPAGIRQVVPDYVSDGVQTAFGFPFPLYDPADIVVLVAPPGAIVGPGKTGFLYQEVLNVNYTVAITSNSSGPLSATVTLTAPQLTGAIIRLMSRRTPSRTTSVVNDGALMSKPFETELDVVEATMQELRRDVDGETTRATAAETAETTRATAAEAAETTRATAAEAAETARALLAESGLQASVVTESARARAAETALSGQIVVEKGRALGVEASLAGGISALATPPIATALGIANLLVLPTSLPPTPGAFWLNGNVLCVTPGGSSPLPTIEPSTSGLFWSNGGAVCIS